MAVLQLINESAKLLVMAVAAPVAQSDPLELVDRMQLAYSRAHQTQVTLALTQAQPAEPSGSARALIDTWPAGAQITQSARHIFAHDRRIRSETLPYTPQGTPYGDRPRIQVTGPYMLPREALNDPKREFDLFAGQRLSAVHFIALVGADALRKAPDLTITPDGSLTTLASDTARIAITIESSTGYVRGARMKTLAGPEVAVEFIGVLAPNLFPAPQPRFAIIGLADRFEQANTIIHFESATIAPQTDEKLFTISARAPTRPAQPAAQPSPSVPTPTTTPAAPSTAPSPATSVPPSGIANPWLLGAGAALILTGLAFAWFRNRRP